MQADMLSFRSVGTTVVEGAGDAQQTEDACGCARCAPTYQVGALSLQIQRTRDQLLPLQPHIVNHVITLAASALCAKMHM